MNIYQQLREVIASSKDVESSLAALKPYIEIEKRFEIATKLISDLAAAVKNKSVPNTLFNDAKDYINRLIDNGVDKYKEKKGLWGRGGGIMDTNVMGAYNLSSAIKEMQKKVDRDNPIIQGSATFSMAEAKSLLDFLKKLVPLNDLIQEAKPLIVKRQPKDPNAPPREPASDEGTCQICARIQRIPGGLIAHHGYTRPGTGWQTSSCLGARHKPYELSRDRLPFAIESVTNYVKNNQKYLKEIKANPPKTFTIITFRKEEKILQRPADYKKQIENHYGSNDYINEYHRKVSDAERNIKEGKVNIKYFQDRYDNWKLKDVKKTGKVKPPTDPYGDLAPVKMKDGRTGYWVKNVGKNSEIWFDGKTEMHPTSKFQDATGKDEKNGFYYVEATIEENVLS